MARVDALSCVGNRLRTFLTLFALEFLAKKLKENITEEGDDDGDFKIGRGHLVGTVD